MNRYFRTLRYLRLSQIIWRLKFKLLRPVPEERSAPNINTEVGQWSAPITKRISLLDAETFYFLNESAKLSDVGWQGSNVSLLWRYNQHYFDDLMAKNASDRFDWHKTLIKDWIIKNAPGVGPGWQPYPLSLRIVNWIKWQFQFNALSNESLNSIAVQARCLQKRLEFHLLANHLFANAKALVFVGLFFEGDEAEGWLNKGIDIIIRELDEQILSDGAHFELTPMYHAIFFEDILDLINILRCFSGRINRLNLQTLALKLSSSVFPLWTWLTAMSHLDNKPGFFNDTAFNIAPSLIDLQAYAMRLGYSLELPISIKQHFKDSGYVCVKNEKFSFIADVAKVGPDYNPGHGHADTLSFELAIGCQRLIVNSGISEYGYGRERERQRSTAAHSTVVVDDENSSEVWSGFRVGRRALPKVDLIEFNRDNFLICASHNGYSHKKNRIVHRRVWTQNNLTLTVKDKILGYGNAECVAYYHLHPDLILNPIHQNLIEISNPHFKVIARIYSTEKDCKIINSSWHPEFGVVKQNKCFRVRKKALLPIEIMVHIEWFN